MPDKTFKVLLPEGADIRLDSYLARHIGFSRSQLKARRARAAVNGKAERPAFRVKDGDIIEVEWRDSGPCELVPEDIPLDVIYENERVIVVNKAAGMVVHPGAGNRSGTLVNALLARFAKDGLSSAGGGPGMTLRPFIAHRLDKDTSGVIIAARDGEALEFLQAQFRARTVRKRYIAVVCGVPPKPEGIIDARIRRDAKNRKRFTVTTLASQGRSAVTRYKVKDIFEHEGRSYARLVLKPETGRTHQLRVHLKSIGCPIAGDVIYGKPAESGLMLHARRLAIKLPGNARPGVFTAPVPARFKF